jgi:hypothetical protein
MHATRNRTQAVIEALRKSPCADLCERAAMPLFLLFGEALGASVAFLVLYLGFEEPLRFSIFTSLMLGLPVGGVCFLVILLVCHIPLLLRTVAEATVDTWAMVRTALATYDEVPPHDEPSVEDEENQLPGQL